MNNRYTQGTLADWVSWLRGGILIPDADEGVVSALCYHLADLGILVRKAEDDWRIDNPLTGHGKEEMEQRLNDLATSERGFALRYFLKKFADSAAVKDLPAASNPETESGSANNSLLLDRTTANLSNLQIVKKYGRQMQSFIELEKTLTEKLIGEQTSPKEARKIFNYILSRVQKKAAPRPWEQLSRRRHR